MFDEDLSGDDSDNQSASSSENEQEKTNGKITKKMLQVDNKAEDDVSVVSMLISSRKTNSELSKIKMYILRSGRTDKEHQCYAQEVSMQGSDIS